MKSKSDTITEIMRINPSVGATFLSEFTNDDLVRYLRRLRDLGETTHRSAQKLTLHACALSRSDALQSA
jgi:hypothetical protein